MSRPIKKDYAVKFLTALYHVADDPTKPLDQLTGEVSALSTAMVANGIRDGMRNILRHAHQGAGKPYGPDPHLVLENGRWRTTRALGVEYRPFEALVAKQT